MAIPAIVGTPTSSKSVNSMTVSKPTGSAAGDVCVVFIATDEGQLPPTTTGQSPKFIAASDSGWTQMTGSPQTCAGAATLSAFYRVLDGGALDAVATGDSGAFQVYNCLTFNGIDAAVPLEQVTFGADTTSDQDLSLTAITTQGADRLVIGAATNGTASNTAQFSAWTNANLANPSAAEAADANTNAGGGGGAGSYTGGKAAAGSTGATTVALAAASSKAFVHFAVRPAGSGQVYEKTGYGKEHGT